MEVSAVVGLVNFQLCAVKKTSKRYQLKMAFILFPYELLYPVCTTRIKAQTENKQLDKITIKGMKDVVSVFHLNQELKSWFEWKLIVSFHLLIVPWFRPPSEEEFPKFVVQNTEMCHNTNTISSALIKVSINKAKLTSQGQLCPALLIKSWKPEWYTWWSNMTAGSLMQTDREDLLLVCRKTDICTLRHPLPCHPASEIAAKWFVNGQIDVHAVYVDGHNW